MKEFRDFIEASKILLDAAVKMDLEEDWGDVVDELDMACRHIETALRMLNAEDES